MFEPASVAGMLVGLVIIAGATYLLVRGHTAREREGAETPGVPETPPPHDGDTAAG